MTCMMKSNQAQDDRSTNKFEQSKNGRCVVGLTSKGEAFLFDSSDWELVKSYTWHISKRGYVSTHINRILRPLHKVLIGNTAGFDVDHISRDKLDNRRRNLRLCTHQENTFNQKLRATNTSNYIGVSFLKKAGKYEAYVHFDGKKHYLGLYENASDAAAARDKRAVMLFGEYANLNFPLPEAVM